MMGQPVNEKVTIGVDTCVRGRHHERMGTEAGEPRKLTRDQARQLATCDKAAQEQLRETRRLLLLELRGCGWTLAELAALLGVSKQRVHLLTRER